jgi:thiol-disulfide isomerase/thioredoxin
MRGWAGVAMAGMMLCGCDRNTTPSQIGRPAPVFHVSDGRSSVDLASLRGRVVVLNFWASWCAPCLEELPSLEALHHQLPQVVVLAVSTDDDSVAYQTFLQRNHVDLMTVDDAAQTSNALYGTFRYPETYIIDKNGIVRRKLIGPQEFSSAEMVEYLRRLAE